MSALLEHSLLGNMQHLLLEFRQEFGKLKRRKELDNLRILLRTEGVASLLDDRRIW